MSTSHSAILYRMVLPDHTCPYGIRAKEMLEQAGYEVDDRLLQSREEVDAFKDANGLSTTPQIIIGDAVLNGSDALETYLESRVNQVG